MLDYYGTFLGLFKAFFLTTPKPFVYVGLAVINLLKAITLSLV